jgi:YVTN family beta-propeller protein
LYVNHQSVSGTLPVTPNIVSKNLAIGNTDYGSGSQRQFDGLIDEVQVYNRALSSSEVISICDGNGDGICDSVPPTVTITSPIRGSTANTDVVEITGTAADSASGLQRVEVSIDGGAFMTATGTTSWSFTTSSLANGNHRVIARAVDNDNNIATTGSFNAIQRIKLQDPAGAGDGGASGELEINPNSNTGYLRNGGDLYVFNLSTGAFGRFSTSAGSGTALAVNPNTNRVYLGGVFFSSNVVKVVDGATGGVIASIGAPGAVSFDAVVNPVTNRVYFAGSGIRVMDGVTNSFIATISGVDGRLAIDPSTNRIYVQTTNSISVIDGNTNSVIATIPLSGSATANGLNINTITHRIYSYRAVSPNQFLVFDGAAHTQVAALTLGSPGHFGDIDTDTTANIAYASNAQFNGKVFAVDGRTNALAYTISVPSRGGIPNPQDVAVNPLNGRLYVMTQDHGGGNVWVFDTPWPFNVDNVASPDCMPLPSDIVSSWRGEGDASDSIDGNHGSLQNGATFAAGVVEQAFSLDGTNDHVVIPASPNLDITGDVTVEFWAKRQSFGPATSHLLAKGAGGISGVDAPTVYNFAIGGDNRISAGFERADGSNVGISGLPITDQGFHHYAYVRSGNSHQLYVDRTLVASGTFAGAPGNTATIDLILGALREGTGTINYFKGIIDEVRIFNRALSQSEIQDIYEASLADCTDFSPPIITLNGPNPQTVEAGFPYLEFSATAFDDVEGDLTASIVISGAVDSSTVGTYTISYDVSDSSGNVATTIERTVLVQDTTPPSISGPTLTPSIVGNEVELTIEKTITDTVGVVSVTATVHGPSPSDDPVGSSVSLTLLSGAPQNGIWQGTFEFPIALQDAPDGVYTVHDVAEDAAGNSQVLIDGTVLLDRTSPSLSIISIAPTVQKPAGEVSVTASTQDTTSGISSVTAQDMTFETSAVLMMLQSGSTAAGDTSIWERIIQAALPEGPHEIDVVSYDNASPPNTSTAIGGYTVDATPPQIAVPGDLTQEATSVAGAMVEFTVVTSDNYDSVIEAICLPSSGSTFAIGTTLVTCEAVDTAGNSNTASFNVIVQDTTPPELSLPADISVEAADSSGAFIEYSASAIDAVDGPILPDCTPTSGMVFSLGTTEIICLATDSAGNTATAVFQVNVEDTTPPSLTVPSDILVVTTNSGGLVVSFAASATDTVDDSPDVSCNPESGSTFPAGETVVDCTATDDSGNTASATFTLIVLLAPTAVTNGPYAAVEGATVTLDGSGSSDIDGTIVTYAWDLNGDAAFDDATGVTAMKVFQENGLYTIGLMVTDDDGLTAAVTSEVTVTNAVPIVGAISAPIEPTQVSAAISTSSSFTDEGTLDTHTAQWSWGDGTTSAGTVTESSGSGTVTGTHSYTTPGVYTVELSVTDDDDDSGLQTFQYVVIYDPTAGFVTGGGWIDSPAGAYGPDASLTGKAIFGFTSKYEKGATTPTGKTSFKFHMANLDFNSDTYEWLVVAGAKAQYKGTGTINGDGDYGFMLTAIDGQITGGGGVDKFRMKIWDKATDTVVYDNQMGALDDANPVTVIGAGSIKLHK